MAERTNPHANLIIGAQDEASPVFDKIKASSQSMAAGVEQAAAKAAGAVGGIGDKAAPAAQKLDGVTASMIRQVQRLNAELEAGSARNAAYFEKMATIKGADAAALAPYLAQLKQAEAAQRVATTGLDQMGVSAKQTAAALRQVPTQFTDIVVSLQGGQSAMQVFLQQGGQLKDMFGGAGNAVRAMGGYVMGLINPFTLAAAAIASIAVAYKQGSAEADAYNMALVMTGNAAGTTASQMQQMAGRISSVVGTQGAAAEALAQMAASGRVASQSLEYFSEVAIKFERATGTAISETVQRFAELGASPVEASRKLNEQTNYLTASIYEQIKALKDQGREADAAALAQTTYADALNNRSAQITQNLGAIEGAWKAIKDAAKSGWDAMLNIGRSDSLETQIDNVRAKIAQAKGLDPNRRHSMPWDTPLAELEQQLANLTEQERMLRRGAEAQAQRTQAEKEAIAAADALQKTQASGMTNQQKMNKALEEYARHIEKLKATNPASALLSPDAIARGEKAIRDQFSDKGKGSSGTKAVNKDLADQARLIAELSGLTGTFSKDWDDLSAAYARGGMSMEQLVEKQAALLAKQPAIKDATEEQAKAQQTLDKANLEAAASREKYIASLATGLDKIQAEIASQEEATARMGLSKEAIAELDAAKLDMMATDLELQAIKAMDRNLDEQTYDALKQQAQAYRDLAKAKRAGAAKEVAVDAAKKAADEWQRTSDQVNQSLTDALMRGFESGKDFAKNLRDTVVNMFKTMVLRPVISAIVSPVAGALTSALGFAGTASAATGAASGGTGLGSIVSAGSSIYSALTTGVSNSITAAFGKFATSSVGTSLGLSTPAVMGNNPSAYVAPQLSSAGSAIGTGLGMAGSGLAGYGISSAISNGYTTGGNTVNAIAGIASAFLGPIAGVVGGLINRAFGRKFKDAGIEGTFSGSEGFSGNAFQFYKGGWFRSDKTVRSDLAPELDTALDKGYASVRTSTAAMAEALGIGTTSLDNFTTSIKISFNGLNEQQIQEKLAEALGGVGDEMAAPLLEGTGAIIRSGETAGEALQRLGGSLLVVNDAFENLGFATFDASMSSGEAASQITEAFGGLDAFGTATSAYFQAMYTEAEQASAAMGNLSDTFADLGVEAPTSADALRQLVEAQDLTTEAGRAMFASLVQIGPAFASVMDQMQQSIGLTGDSLKSVFQNVLQEANSAEEARILGEQAAGQLLMDAISNALVGTVTDLVSNAVLQPITQSIVGAAAQAATMDVAAASVAGMNLAAGGAAGGMNLAAGGAAGGANVAAGGAVAGQGLAEVVGKAIGVTNAMVEILSSADFQTAFGNAITAIGSISGTLFKGLGTIESSMPGFGGGGFGGGGGGGGGGSSATDNKNPLDDLLNERRQLEIELMKAQGKEEEALAEIRKDAIKGMTEEAVAAWDYNRALEKQIEQAQQLASLQEDRAGLQIALLQAQGKEEEALALIREQAIKGMTKEAVALYDANKAVEEQIRVLESLADFAKAGKELRAELLALQGDTAGANALLRQLAVEGLTALEIAAYDANEALKKQINTLKERQGLEEKLADLLGDSTAKRKRERDAIDESNRALYDRITAIEDSKVAAQAAMAALEKSVQAEKDKLTKDYEAQIDELQERVSSISEVVRDLDSALKSVRGTLESTTEQSQIAARLTLQSVLSAVNAGASVSSFSSVISQAAGTLSKNDTNNYIDRASYVRAQARSADLLDALKGVGGAQLTTAELQLETLEDWRDDELSKLDNILENARTQLEAAQGTHTGVLTLSAAMAGFSAAIAALGAAMRGTVTGGGGSLLPPGTIVSRPREELPHYAGGGYYGGGLALVGERGPELINFAQPGMVYTAQQTGQILNNSEVLAELRAVRLELSEMKAETRRTADAVNGRPEQPMLVENVA